MGNAGHNYFFTKTAVQMSKKETRNESTIDMYCFGMLKHNSILNLTQGIFPVTSSVLRFE